MLCTRPAFFTADQKFTPSSTLASSVPMPMGTPASARSRHRMIPLPSRRLQVGLWAIFTPSPASVAMSSSSIQIAWMTCARSLSTPCERAYWTRLLP